MSIVASFKCSQRVRTTIVLNSYIDLPDIWFQYIIKSYESIPSWVRTASASVFDNRIDNSCWSGNGLQNFTRTGGRLPQIQILHCNWVWDTCWRYLGKTLKSLKCDLWSPHRKAASIKWHHSNNNMDGDAQWNHPCNKDSLLLYFHQLIRDELYCELK